jgi:hypothetical protein
MKVLKERTFMIHNKKKATARAVQPTNYAEKVGHFQVPDGCDEFLDAVELDLAKTPGSDVLDPQKGKRSRDLVGRLLGLLFYSCSCVKHVVFLAFNPEDKKIMHHWRFINDHCMANGTKPNMGVLGGIIHDEDWPYFFNVIWIHMAIDDDKKNIVIRPQEFTSTVQELFEITKIDLYYGKNKQQEQPTTKIPIVITPQNAKSVEGEEPELTSEQKLYMIMREQERIIKDLPLEQQKRFIDTVYKAKIQAKNNMVTEEDYAKIREILDLSSYGKLFELPERVNILYGDVIEYNGEDGPIRFEVSRDLDKMKREARVMPRLHKEGMVYLSRMLYQNPPMDGYTLPEDVREGDIIEYEGECAKVHRMVDAGTGLSYKDIFDQTKVFAENIQMTSIDPRVEESIDTQAEIEKEEQIIRDIELFVNLKDND